MLLLSRNHIFTEKNKNMITENTIDTSQAILSNQGDMTSFSFAEEQIRFRSPKILERYIDIKEWDKGYLEVTALYKGIGKAEEYIDLIPILRNLCINPEKFLKPIKSVIIKYDEPV